MHGSYNDAREKFQVKKKDSSIRKAHREERMQRDKRRNRHEHCD